MRFQRRSVAVLTVLVLVIGFIAMSPGPAASGPGTPSLKDYLKANIGNCLIGRTVEEGVTFIATLVAVGDDYITAQPNFSQAFLLPIHQIVSFQVFSGACQS